MTETRERFSLRIKGIACARESNNDESSETRVRVSVWERMEETEIREREIFSVVLFVSKCGSNGKIEIILRDKRVLGLKKGTKGREKKDDIYETSSRIRLTERRIELMKKIVCYIFFTYRCHCLFMNCLFYVFFSYICFLLMWKERGTDEFFLW